VDGVKIGARGRTFRYWSRGPRSVKTLPGPAFGPPQSLFQRV